jgi:hypothetical protein
MKTVFIKLDPENLAITPKVYRYKNENNYRFNSDVHRSFDHENCDYFGVHITNTEKLKLNSLQSVIIDGNLFSVNFSSTQTVPNTLFEVVVAEYRGHSLACLKLNDEMLKKLIIEKLEITDIYQNQVIFSDGSYCINSSF